MIIPSPKAQDRLIMALKAAFAIPFIDDIEDYIWEAVFAYMQDIPLVDPLTTTRAKLLFDVVHPTTHRGWSAKALRHSLVVPSEFEVVIQRADIFKKHHELGYEKLSLETPPAILGEALLRHWYQKVEMDAQTQQVLEQRICILLKSKNLKRFAYLEEPLNHYDTADLIWQWTDETHTGLQGIRRADHFCVFRWYPNQKQLFERFKLTVDVFQFALTPQRLPLEILIPQLLHWLNTP